MKILVIQGANMEYLGRRQPELYGTTTPAELDTAMREEARKYDLALDIRYTNIEGEAITRIYQAARDGIDGLLMNPAGFLYQGFALRDCLRGVRLPYIEVHMTNLEKRGMHSVLAEESHGMIVGLGLDSYSLGLEALIRVIKRQTPS